MNGPPGTVLPPHLQECVSLSRVRALACMGAGVKSLQFHVLHGCDN